MGKHPLRNGPILLLGARFAYLGIIRVCFILFMLHRVRRIYYGTLLLSMRAENASRPGRLRQGVFAQDTCLT